jgi:hypothetical protein
MFGTELDTAYLNTNVQNQPSKMIPPIIKQEEPSNNTHQEDTHSHHQPQQNTYEPIMSQPPIFQQNDAVIKELQYELEKQKYINKRDGGEPLIERYLSKKKDVMKLINISLSVLFAISIHFVFGDLIKEYLTNNDFTNNKEIFIKCMYPVSVLLILWTLKVFNK